MFLVATTQIHFLFQGNYYDHIDGVAMGSPGHWHGYLLIFSWATMKEFGCSNTMVLQFISTEDMWMTPFDYSTTKRMLWNFSNIKTINTQH